LPIIINNKTICECANRLIPCNANLQENINNDNKTRYHCEDESIIQQKRELSLLKANDGKVNFHILQSFIII